MKKFAGYFFSYFREEWKWLYAVPVILFLIATTWIFYTNKEVASLIGGGAAGFYRLPANLIIFGISFAFPLLWYLVSGQHREGLRKPAFWLMAAAALIFFCFKVFFYWQRPLAEIIGGGGHMSYWQNCISNLLSAFLLVVPVFLWWFFTDRKSQPFYGISARNFDWKPYLILMAVMIPLVLIAAQQPSFQKQYPKVFIVLQRGNVGDNQLGHGLFFELCYGLDFLATEIFFRGFLVIGLAKFLGRGAILPAAVFYVFIHFGKPLGETIGSFAGGILLGILAFETKSVWGGVLLHLGTAWVMELAGVLFRH